MKRILCSLLVATLPFGGVHADALKSKNAKLTLVYQHELPNVPGKSIKGVLVEYGPGGYSPWGYRKAVRAGCERAVYSWAERKISHGRTGKRTRTTLPPLHDGRTDRRLLRRISACPGRSDKVDMESA